MTDETNTPETNDQTPNSEAFEDAAEAETSVEALKAENAELKDRMLRTMAEMENLRRRTVKDVQDAKQYSVASFARDILAVGDNLRRALEVLTDETRANADDGVKALIEGVEMTEREMLNQMEKHGVTRIDPMGQRFDPNFHQAMFEIPDTQTPNNTVAQVVQVGYVIGERVLRPALVGVAKGGPKEMKPDEGQAGAGSEATPPGATVDRSA